MDSLVLLCARRVVAQRHLCALPALPTLPLNLYPVLFQLAFLDGKTLVLQDLVATWPFPELNLQRLVGRRELLPGDTWKVCVHTIIQAVVAQLRRVLEDPGCHYSLRVLDMTGLPYSMSSRTFTGTDFCSTTSVLAEACMQVSVRQEGFQRHGSIWPEGCSGAATTKTAPQPPSVDVHADLCVDRNSYWILCCALQTRASSPMCLKCHEFKAKKIAASEVVTLWKSLDPSCLQRVDLHFSNLELTELWVILPQLPRFPELRSLKLLNSNVDLQRPAPKSSVRSLFLPKPVVMLGSSQFSRNLHQTLSFHAPALKRLDLKGLDISKGFLEPLQLLLEETSASLLHLDLRECRMADSHLDTLLPTLRRCSHLRFLGLHGNDLSRVALKDLLQKILELPDLHLVVFPFPVDCYKLARLESDFDFVTDEELLAAATAEFSQILVNSGRTDLDWTYNPDGHEALD